MFFLTAAIEEIRLKMTSVKHKILVLSGKGGVGKSTFSAHLSHALASDDSTEVSLKNAVHPKSLLLYRCMGGLCRQLKQMSLPIRFSDPNLEG